MSIADKHPLPWKVAQTYQYRADIHDANGKLVMMVKPPANQQGVADLAQHVVDAANAGKGGSVPANHADTGTGAADAGSGTEEPQFAGHPLSFFDQYQTEEELTELDGVGAKTAAKIMEAREAR